MKKNTIIFIDFKSMHEIVTGLYDDLSFTVRGATVIDTIDRYFVELSARQFQFIDHRPVPTFLFEWFCVSRLIGVVDDGDGDKHMLIVNHRPFGLTLSAPSVWSCDQVMSLPEILAKLECHRDHNQSKVDSCRQFVFDSLEPDFWESMS